ncbi:MAG: 5'-3' exonuclease, partial [Hydrogenobacter sp.]
VSVINPMNGEVFTKKSVIEKFGVPPELIPDYLALVGDKVDNVEGIKGIGKKTAVKVLEKYGSVENILKNFEEFKMAFPQADKEKLELSYFLVKLQQVPDIDLREMDMCMKEPDVEKLKERLTELEMKSLLKDVDVIFRGISQKSLF